VTDERRHELDPEQGLAIFTIGHSNHELQHFIGLLRRHRIAAVADVRSHPRSRFASRFDRGALGPALNAAGIGYVFLGLELGGRPNGPEYYDYDGRVRYDRVADSTVFAEGLRRLFDGAARMRVAITCAEEDPTDCHRRLLVGRVLLSKGVGLQHIRGDGRLQEDPDLNASDTAQAALFDDMKEERAWRSTRSVLAASTRPSSSVS
jgi:uncharacterized protein (DUF488 family)